LRNDFRPLKRNAFLKWNSFPTVDCEHKDHTWEDVYEILKKENDHGWKPLIEEHRKKIEDGLNEHGSYVFENERLRELRRVRVQRYSYNWLLEQVKETTEKASCKKEIEKSEYVFFCCEFFFVGRQLDFFFLLVMVLEKNKHIEAVALLR